MNAVARAAPPAMAGPARAVPPSWIRGAVRDVLEASPGYHDLSPGDRQSLAQSMVKVSALAADLIDEEGEAQRDVRRQSPPLARAQSQPGFGESAQRIGGITRDVLNAVSFPRFVTDLINGVFRAMLDSSTQQMQQYVQLLNAVSASAEGFERAQFGMAQVRQWVADQFPAIEYELPDAEDAADPEALEDIRLRLRDGASMPGEEEVRATLGIPPGEPVSAGNPEQLVPLARRHLARQRQQMLATMVMMGMHRIVIDSGRINAAMRFHIDTRSAASEDRGSEFSLQNRIRAGAKASLGPWGASAEIENNIGYVSTQRNQATEEINTDLELTSSVELNFRSDYLPLNRMAAQTQADRIRNTSLNPATETALLTARSDRSQRQHESERARRTAMDTAVADAIQPPADRTPLEVPEPQSTETPPAGAQPAGARRSEARPPEAQPTDSTGSTAASPETSGEAMPAPAAEASSAPTANPATGTSR